MKKILLFNVHRHLKMRVRILTAVLLLSSMLAQGQMIVTNGTTIQVVSGTSVTSNENLNLLSGANLDNQGTVILKKDLANGNAVATSLGSGTFVFSGAVNQTISGMNVLQNIMVNNATRITSGGNTRVNGVLNLTSGLVSTGSYNLVLGPLATVAGVPSASSMVEPTGPGQLRKEFSSAGSFTFPVGDATGTAEYSPVTLAFNSGSFAPGSYAGVSLVNAQYPGTGATYLRRYWNVSQSGISGFSCNATFNYVDADVVGPESDIFCFRVVPAPFTAYNAAIAGMNQIDARGLSGFGTFTGNIGDAAVPPEVRSLQDKTITGGPDCADANQTLLIAGNGTTYIVTATGNVKHIAGTNIIYYPGTKVILGGYLHGYISTTFCTPYIHPEVQAQQISRNENPETGSQDNSFFRIYPNPTPDDFILELKGNATTSEVHVEIFSLHGKKNP